MKKILGFICALFPLFNPSKINAQTRKPSFSVIQATSNNGELLSVGTIDISYKNFNDKARYPWCLLISIALDERNLFDNKLPRDGESAIANNLEDRIITEIEKMATLQYVGHIYYDGFLDIYIYLNDPKSISSYLTKEMKSKTLVREFGYVIEHDPNWSKVSKYMN